MKYARIAFAITGTLGLLAGVTAFAQQPPPSAPAVHPFIVGGRPAEANEVPWQVALVQGSGSSLFQFCGGSLVAPNWVLTAAHCVDNAMVAKDPKRLSVIAGTNDYRSGGTRSEVEKVIVNPKWGQTGTQYDFDATLLKLKTPVTVVAPIKIATASGTPPVGQRIRVTGWGAISESGPVSSKLLLADIPVVSNDDCNKPEAYDGRISAQMFCAGLREGGLDSCQGDSGGPLITSDDHGGFHQIGIVSWGRSCGLPNSYSINTRVAAFETWIGSAIGLQPAPQAPGTTSEPSPQLPPAPPPRPAGSAPPQEVPTATVAQNTLPRDNPAGLTIELVQGDMLKIGQSAQFKVSTEKPGYLLLIDLTPDGKMTQIFPNARSLAARTSIRRNLIEPGRPLLVPDHRDLYAGFEFKVEPPTGRGLLVALLTDQALKSIPTPDTPMTMGRTAAIDYIAKLAEDLDRDLVVTGPARPRAWSVATKPYRIDP